MLNDDGFTSLTHITQNGMCEDPDCGCDEQPEAMRHERSTTVRISLLHYLAKEAMCHLVFLDDGRVWVGDDSDDLRGLAQRLDEEEEADVFRRQVGAATKAAEAKAAQIKKEAN
jgi:exosome complex RNA-binding protein Rrp4